MPRFVYLKYALSLVLVGIGGKMIANFIYCGKFVPTEVALLMTVVLIGGAILLSLIRTRGAVPPAPERVATGWVPGSPARAAPDNASERTSPNA